MEIRNPIYNANGGIDVEYNHPTHGWIPFSAHPEDPEALGPEIYNEALKINPAPYVAPPPPEPTFEPLTPPQFHAMIAISGKKTQITQAINAIPDPAAKATALAYFEYSTLYHRDSPLFAQLAPLVGLSDKDVDALWTQASQIRV